MIYTDEQARTLWCPYVQANTMPDGFALNRDSDPETAHTGCLGSRCAAWRWWDNRYELITLRDGAQPDGDGWHRAPYQYASGGNITWRRPTADRRGYCGRVGRPNDETPI